jgi:Transcriptional regulatory protein, C terminal
MRLGNPTVSVPAAGPPIARRHSPVDPPLQCWAGGSAGKLAEYRILGTFEVLFNGERVQLGMPKLRALLAILWLEANQILSTDRLNDLIWGDAASSAARSVQICVSELRWILSEFRMPARSTFWPLTGSSIFVGDAHRFGGGMGGSWHARPGGSGCG